MPIELYVGLEKFSCDMCGDLSRPEYRVKLVGTTTKTDICEKCYSKSVDHEPFKKGIKDKKIEVIKL